MSLLYALSANGKESWKMIQIPGKNPDCHQNLNDFFLGHAPPLRKISSKFVHNFFRDTCIVFTRKDYTRVQTHTQTHTRIRLHDAWHHGTFPFAFLLAFWLIFFYLPRSCRNLSSADKKIKQNASRNAVNVL